MHQKESTITALILHCGGQARSSHNQNLALEFLLLQRMLECVQSSHNPASTLEMLQSAESFYANVTGAEDYLNVLIIAINFLKYRIKGIPK